MLFFGVWRTDLPQEWDPESRKCDLLGSRIDDSERVLK